MSINYKRIKELIDGDDPLESVEEFFVIGLDHSRNGDLLGDLMLEHASKIETATVEELIHLMVGYGQGQKEIWLEISGELTPDKKDKIH